LILFQQLSLLRPQLTQLGAQLVVLRQQALAQGRQFFDLGGEAGGVQQQVLVVVVAHDFTIVRGTTSVNACHDLCFPAGGGMFKDVTIRYSRLFRFFIVFP